MKQALLVLVASTFGFGMIQTSVAAETEIEIPMDYALEHSVTNFGSLENTYRSINSSPTTSDDEISEAIKALSVQAQDKEDSLSALAEKLSEHSKKIDTSKSQISKPQNFSVKSKKVNLLDSSAAPVIAATRAASAAHSRSIGRCARYIRKALQAAGYEFTPNESAYQYASRGTLKQAGFVKISNNSTPQVGDVVVFNRSAKHRHGHIQIFDGTQWVSDFRQDDINPYSDSYNYTTWRDARYLDDASDKGIYLAMAE